MGELSIQTVMKVLAARKIPARRAYPGIPVLRIPSLVAAVQLEQIDQAEQSVTVLVSILAPATKGAALVEDEAMRFCEAAAGEGGVCLQRKCQYLSDTDVFSVPVSVKFRRTQETA